MKKTTYYITDDGTNEVLDQIRQYDDTNALNWCARRLARLKRIRPKIQHCTLYRIEPNNSSTQIQGFYRRA